MQLYRARSDFYLLRRAEWRVELSADSASLLGLVGRGSGFIVAGGAVLCTCSVEYCKRVLQFFMH